MELKFSKIIDRLEALVSKFADDNAEPATNEENEQSFAEATLMDGTVISYEGELAEGTAIFVVTEEGESVPAPEGTHALGGDLEGVSIVLDADGIITEVIDERESQEPGQADEQMSKEEIDGMIESKINEALSQLPLESIAKALETILNSNEDFSSKLEGLTKEFNEFKEKPSDKEENEQKFARAETPAEARANRLKNRFKK